MSNDFCKILIISSSAWNDSNSFGNTFSNLFSGWDREKILNIYCTSDTPNTRVCDNFYQMSEKMIIKNIFNKNKKPGRVLKENYDVVDTLNESEEKIFNSIKAYHLQIFIWMRDIIWLLGNWKSKELLKYIDQFKPDVIFLPMYTTFYMHHVQQFIVNYTKKKFVFYTSDDGCTYKQFNLSPLFWIDRILKRQLYKRVIKKSEYVYVISEKQKKEYEALFRKQCKLLYKGADFTIQPILNSRSNKPIKIIFTGNIGDGRWETLSIIGQALNIINKDNIKLQLHIYTMTPLTKKMKNALDIKKSIIIMGGVPAKEVIEIQNTADILLHVESFRLKEKLKVRLSFSTKLVDYFTRGRCIFAVGSEEVASIDYLMKNDAAIIANTTEEVKEKLQYILDDPEIISRYGQKGWECGKRNHQIEEIQGGLYRDLNSLK